MLLFRLSFSLGRHGEAALHRPRTVGRPPLASSYHHEQRAQLRRRQKQPDHLNQTYRATQRAAMCQMGCSTNVGDVERPLRGLLDRTRLCTRLLPTAGCCATARDHPRRRSQPPQRSGVSSTSKLDAAAACRPSASIPSRPLVPAMAWAPDRRDLRAIPAVARRRACSASTLTVPSAAEVAAALVSRLFCFARSRGLSTPWPPSRLRRPDRGFGQRRIRSQAEGGSRGQSPRQAAQAGRPGILKRRVTTVLRRSPDGCYAIGSAIWLGRARCLPRERMDLISTHRASRPGIQQYAVSLSAARHNTRSR